MVITTYAGTEILGCAEINLVDDKEVPLNGSCEREEDGGYNQRPNCVDGLCCGGVRDIKDPGE